MKSLNSPRSLALAGAFIALASQAQVGAPAAALTVAPADFLAGCQAGIESARAGIARLKAGAPDVLQAYDDATKVLNDTGARGGAASEMHPDAAMRAAGQSCARDVSAVRTDFSLDRALYDALSRVDRSALDPAGRFYLERTLLRFRLAGVDKDAATRARVQALDKELTRLSQEFNKNIREGVLRMQVEPKALAGLPEDFLRAHPPGADGLVTLTTDNTDVFPVMTYARDPGVRERYWKLYRQRAPGNIAVLEQMLARRSELAQLLGFRSWADYITADKMAGNEATAADFIDKIARAAEPRMRRDYALMLARKKLDDPTATAVNPWDSGFLNERIKAERYGVDAREVRPYFQYDNVKTAVLDTTSRLFGIRYVRVEGAKVWHRDVEAYDVFEGAAGGRQLGRIYLDMHPRDAKYKHYAHFRLFSGKQGAALPESILVCNFRQPTASDPGLLEYSDVVTFFHEFGHLVHAVLGGHTRWAGTAGVATERDFVEAPSQLLEEWVRDPKTLQGFAVHYQTGQPIPLELVQKLRRADEVGKGLQVRTQMSYAATSLELHRRDPKGLDTTAVVSELQEKYTPFKSVPGTHFQTAFNHLDNYSAMYYTYMWSLVIAKDMFSAFAANGDIMDPAVATKYRRMVLEPGGSKPAAELVRDFIGRPYSFKAYEDWLNKE